AVRRFRRTGLFLFIAGSPVRWKTWQPTSSQDNLE
ncbi:MAG: hypothetical protein ACI8XZ_005061, partial [Gammaproteobacteria bacterium]